MNLFVIDVTPTTTEEDVVLSVTSHSSPSLDCPTLSMDWSPAYPLICVNGGVMYINSPLDCTVAARVRTWTTIKTLYR